MSMLPISAEYQPRNASRLQDAVAVNAVIEPTGVRKRPGLNLLASFDSAQGLWLNGFALIESEFYRFTFDLPNNWLENFVSDATDQLVIKDNIVYYEEKYWKFGRNPVGLYQFHGHHSSANGYNAWVSVEYSSGIGFTMEFNPRLAIHNNFMFILSKEGTNVLYKSTNGSDISIVNSDVPLYGSLLSFSGRLWIISPYDIIDPIVFRVYSSKDNGVTWVEELVTNPITNFGFSIPRTAISIVHNNAVYFNSLAGLYKSTDLLTWTLVNPNPPVVAKISFRGRMWGVINIITSPTTSISRYYTSPDGITWSELGVRMVHDHFITTGLLSYPIAAVSDGVSIDIYYNIPYVTGMNIHFVIKSTMYSATSLPLPGFVDGGQPFDFVLDNPEVTSAGIVMKTTTQAWYWDGALLAQITDADYPAITVPGIVYLDGTYYVMTPNAVIYGSAINDPTTWTALNTIVATSEPDGGVAIIRHVNYILAFGGWSMEFFYNANGAPPGSALLRIDSSLQLIGCADAGSIAQTQGTVFFMGVTKQRGRSIYLLDGMIAKPISTLYVDRILSNDTLSEVWAFCMRVGGHTFYLLTLVGSNVTLVYDMTTGKWGEWSSLVRGGDQSATVASISGKLVTFTATTPDVYLATNQIIICSDSQYPELNISAKVLRVSTTEFDMELIDTPNVGSIGTALTYTPCTETYFQGKFYSYILGRDFLLTKDGKLYDLDFNTPVDDGKPIHWLVRTEKLDGGSVVEKQQGRLDFAVDAFAGGSLYERHTDDDHISYSKYRRAKILPKRTRLWRLGSFNRRNFEISHIDPVALQIQAIDVDLET